MLETLEIRRLLALIRPDIHYGIEGTLPPPAGFTVYPRQGLANGKLIAAAVSRVAKGGPHYAVTTEFVRYNDNGRLDTTFHSAPITISAGENDSYGTYVSPDGTLWMVVATAGITRGKKGQAAGFNILHYDANGNQLALLRLTPERVRTGHYWASDELPTLTFSPDGTAYATLRQNYTDTSQRLQVQKFSASGVNDTSFNHGAGYLLLALQNVTGGDGGPYLSTVFSQGTPAGITVVVDNGIYQFTPSGRADHTLSATAGSQLPGTNNGVLAIDPQGRFLSMSGETFLGQNLVLRRYRPNGTLDPAFGNGGQVALPEGSATDSTYKDVTFASDSSFTITADFNSTLRVTADGVVDANFVASQNALSSYGYNDYFGAVGPGLPDAAGRIYVTTGDHVIRYVRTSAAADLGNHATLFITGTGGNDTITVSRSGNTINVVVNGQTQTFNAASVHEINANLLAGDDTFTDTSGLAIAVNGGDDNDTITTGDGKAVVNLGSGKNIFHGGNGGGSVVRQPRFVQNTYPDLIDDKGDGDTVTAGRGVWAIDLGGAIIEPGNHSSDLADSVTLTGGQYNVTINIGDDTIVCNTDLPCRINASDGNDRITTGDGNDVILAGAGNDTVNSGGGRDRVYGDVGDDSLNAGSGNDTIVGDYGADTILAGTGDDRIYAGNPDHTADTPSSNVIDGGGGSDILKRESITDQYKRIAILIKL